MLEQDYDDDGDEETDYNDLPDDFSSSLDPRPKLSTTLRLSSSPLIFPKKTAQSAAICSTHTRRCGTK